jgi:hypothetical protein
VSPLTVEAVDEGQRIETSTDEFCDVTWHNGHAAVNASDDGFPCPTEALGVVSVDVPGAALSIITHGLCLRIGLRG